MAKIHVMGINQEMVDMDLMKKRFMVHLEFNSQQLLNKAIELGFDKELWEKNNHPNKVQVRE